MRSLPVFLAACAAAGALAATTPPPDAPLIEDKGIRVDVLDFDAAMMRIPPDKRGDFRLSYDRITSVVDNVFITRSFAEKARALGLDKDPVVRRRLQQVQEDVLANEYLRTLEKQATGNLEQRAYELYLADKEKYVRPEAVHVQHILVGLKGRTKEMAKVRADEAYAKAKAGESFDALIAEYSDDPEKSVNKGDLGLKVPAGFVPPVREAIAKLNRKGDISPPVESDYGYHVVRLVEREPAHQASFDEVKKGLVAAQREKVVKQKIEAAVLDVRSSPTAVGHRENVEALVVPVDDSVLKRALEAQDALARSAQDKEKKAK